MLAGTTLWQGNVLKQSEILGRWNPRWVQVVRPSAPLDDDDRVNVDVDGNVLPGEPGPARSPLVCAYWADEAAFHRSRDAPRGVLDCSRALVSTEQDRLELELRHMRDVLNEVDCFGSRRDIGVRVRVASLGELDGLCNALEGGLTTETRLAVTTVRTYNAERKTVPEANASSNANSSSTSTSASGTPGGGAHTKPTPKPATSKLDSDYELLGELGRGAFSVVYRARRRTSRTLRTSHTTHTTHTDGRGHEQEKEQEKEQEEEQEMEEVAVKVVQLSKLSSRERKTQFRYLNSEVAIMRKVSERLPRSKHVVRLVESFAERRPLYRVCLVLELCNGGELFDRIVSRSFFSEGDAKRLLRSLAGALGELHRAGVVHRDIKPENLIYASRAEDADVKITDFGLAMDVERPDTDVYKAHVVGTSGYFAPEVLRLQYSPACDVWSLGVVLYILLCGYPPFVGRTRMEVQKEIRLARFEFHMPEWAKISEAARSLIQGMLARDPRRRLTPAGVLAHPWLSAAEAAGDAAPLPLDKHKRFNNRRKLKAAALAVMWGARLGHRRKEKLRWLAKRMRPDGMRSEDLDTIKACFDAHASSAKEGANLADLAAIMSELGYHGLPLERIFELFDENGDGFIDQTELLAGLGSLQCGEDSMRFCFRVYDKDGSGDLDKDELFRVLSMTICNSDLDPDKVATELADAFDDIDVDKNGKISFDEFKVACQTKPYLVEGLLSRRLASRPPSLVSASLSSLSSAAESDNAP